MSQGKLPKKEPEPIVHGVGGDQKDAPMNTAFVVCGALDVFLNEHLPDQLGSLTIFTTSLQSLLLSPEMRGNSSHIQNVSRLMNHSQDLLRFLLHVECLVKSGNRKKVVFFFFLLFCFFLNVIFHQLGSDELKSMAQRHQDRVVEFANWFANKQVEVPGVHQVFKRILKLEEFSKAITFDLQKKLLAFEYKASFEQVCVFYFLFSIFLCFLLFF